MAPDKGRTSDLDNASEEDGATAPADPPPPSAGTERPTLSRNPDADPVRLHREYVQRRLGGGALPTPEAYRRAADQWRSIPGAVSGAAAQAHPPDEAELARRLGLGSGELPLAEELEFSGDEDEVREEYDGPLPATDPGDNAPYEEGRS